MSAHRDHLDLTNHSYRSGALQATLECTVEVMRRARDAIKKDPRLMLDLDHRIRLAQALLDEITAIDADPREPTHAEDRS